MAKRPGVSLVRPWPSAAGAIPEGLTPEIAAQFDEPEGTAPANGVPPATEPTGTGPGESAPTGSAPTEPELGPPHFTLGMVHEFTVT
jgi:hypothetical protein